MAYKPYKPHPVWKPNEMCACPQCSAYVPKVLFQFHRCPPGSGLPTSVPQPPRRSLDGASVLAGVLIGVAFTLLIVAWSLWS